MTLAKRKPATRPQQDYQDRARALGCVVCIRRQQLGLQEPKWGQCGSTHIHHRNLGDLHGQKQIGQDAVVSMGAWHHDGVIEIEWPPMSRDDMEAIYGPSFKSAKPFREMTADLLPHLTGRGTERWQQFQDEILGEA